MSTMIYPLSAGYIYIPHTRELQRVTQTKSKEREGKKERKERERERDREREREMETKENKNPLSDHGRNLHFFRYTVSHY